MVMLDNEIKVGNIVVANDTHLGPMIVIEERPNSTWICVPLNSGGKCIFSENDLTITTSTYIVRNKVI